MPRVGFQSTIPLFERAKALHALERAATGNFFDYFVGYKIIL
jgi:hypothetical protein